jgi:hypothetical protein
MRTLAVLAVLLIVGGAVYMLKDVGRIPMFSANLERLAETPTEAACTGKAFWTAKTKVDRKEAATVCRLASQATDTDLQTVQKVFCQAVTKAGYQPGTETCMQIMVANRFWPTYDGAITNSWSRKFPYPGTLILQDTSTADDSRTGGREGNFRE